MDYDARIDELKKLIQQETDIEKLRALAVEYERLVRREMQDRMVGIKPGPAKPKSN